MQHGVALEWRQRLRTVLRDWPKRQRGRIEVRDDGQNARCALGSVHRNVTDAPAGYRALHQSRVRETGKVHVDRVGGGTHHLEPPVDAISRGADYINCGCCAHTFASLAVANARTMVRFASSILKWLCSRATAPANAISAASRNVVVTRLAARQDSARPRSRAMAWSRSRPTPASLLEWCRRRDRGRRPLMPARTRSSPGP